jgi:GTP-binding protein
VGRPNVGKSALFNRLVQKRQSLVDASPGLTRDRLYGDVTWAGRTFRIVDTGGLEFSSGDRMQKAIASQVILAMEEASVALFLLDGRDGLMPLDRQVTDWLRRLGKPVLPVVNKVDGDVKPEGIHEFSELGLGSPWAVSGLHGLGVGELLDAVVERLKKTEAIQDLKGSGTAVPDPTRIAIIGRPNVGKSSLLNRILNQERVLVDDRPGTTRDPVETEFQYKEQRFLWIDTAGVRARKTVKDRVGAVARIKALEVITTADVCVGVLDATVGVLRDDLRLLDQVITASKPLCLAVNKWDLLPRSADPKQIAAAVARRAPFLRFSPVIATSAKTGFQVLKLIELAAGLAAQARKRLTSAEIRALFEILRNDGRAPPGLRHAHLIRLSQVGTAPPSFHLMARIRGRFSGLDANYVEKVLREQGGFEGTPVRVKFLVKRR